MIPLTQHDRDALAEAAALVLDVQRRHTLDLSGQTIIAASVAVHDIQRFGWLLEGTSR